MKLIAPAYCVYIHVDIDQFIVPVFKVSRPFTIGKKTQILRGTNR